MSVQYFADASQKFTWPALIGPEVGVTVAVRVTIVPDGTVVTGPELDDTPRAVVVINLLCAGAARLAPRNRAMTKLEGICWKVIDENRDLTRRIAALADEKQPMIEPLQSHSHVRLEYSENS